MLGNYNNAVGDDWVNGETFEVIAEPYDVRNPVGRWPISLDVWDTTWVFGDSWLIPEPNECTPDVRDFPTNVCTNTDDVETVCNNLLAWPYRMS